MPYTLNTVPAAIKKLPKHAQEIYVGTFNSAYKEHNGDEGTANAIAWSAIKKLYRKKGNVWVAKESVGISQQNRIDMLQTALSVRFPRVEGQPGTWIRDVWQDDFVYSMGDINYKMPYVIGEDGKVTLGDPVKVMQHTEYVPAAEKLEDGVAYPRSAYAYVPDPSKPETWKLRLWESIDKGITKGQLNKASVSLSPGGLNGDKVTIPAADLSSVKSRIREEYKKLDLDDKDIPRWVKESAEVRDYIHESIKVELNEVTAEKLAKGILPVRIIKGGFNVGKGRFYSESAVKDAVKVFEGIKMYANHPTPTEEKERPERDIRDWVATLKNNSLSPQKNAVGEAHIHAGWFKEMVQNLHQIGNLDQLGTSINAIGKGLRQKIEEVETFYVEGLVKGRSVDFVTEPGAGGQAGLTESTSDILDALVIDLDTLKEVRPDLVEALKSEGEEITESNKLKEGKHKMELEEQVTTLESQNKVLAKENTELKTLIETSTVEKAKADTKILVKEAVDKSTLPEAAKNRILDLFKDAADIKGLEEAIKAEMTYIEKLSGAGKVKGMGAPIPDPKATRAGLVESVKRLNPKWTDDQVNTFIDGQ